MLILWVFAMAKFMTIVFVVSLRVCSWFFLCVFSESNFGVAGADRFWSTLLAGSSSLRMSKSKPL